MSWTSRQSVEKTSVEEMRNYIFLYFNKQFDLKSNGYNKYQQFCVLCSVYLIVKIPYIFLFCHFFMFSIYIVLFPIFNFSKNLKSQYHKYVEYET